MHEAWGADIQEQHGPNADSFYDDTLASPHADSFVTAGSDRNRQSSLASILGIDTNHSPTSAVTIKALPFRQHDYEHEPSPLALNPADTLEEEKASHDTAASDEETMRRIEHRWDKVGADLPYVLTAPRPPTATTNVKQKKAHMRVAVPVQRPVEIIDVDALPDTPTPAPRVASRGNQTHALHRAIAREQRMQ